MKEPRVQRFWEKLQVTPGHVRRATAARATVLKGEEIRGPGRSRHDADLTRRYFHVGPSSRGFNQPGERTPACRLRLAASTRPREDLRETVN